MSSKKTILIAEDSFINRKVLAKILSDEYTLLESENGQEALDMLEMHGTSVSAIILDLVMPVLDGFGFLRAISKREEYKNIPIIVATGNGGDESEVGALELGAWDFITKPYNGDIIRFRLRNAIERSQLSAFNQLKYLAEFDTLTGIYNKSKFFQVTREMLNAYPNEKFAFVRLDIDRFQLVNSFFGMDEGDRLLCFLAGALKAADPGSKYTYGRIEADVFAICFTYSEKGDVIRELERSKERVKAFNRSFDIVPIFGVYFLDDLSLPVTDMLDRAALAAKTCKGNYLDTIAVYRPEFIRKLEKEQEIINEMTGAMEQRQFCIYLQPKYSLLTNTPAGAEALVRWKHPKKGMIPPDEFIPVFEKNGYIAKLDYYVWETTCGMLRDWITHGITPYPVSVNVSRVNLYNPQLVSLLTNLVEKYDIPPHLLQLEVTESAYMDNPQTMEQMIAQLHTAGFTVLMDDFGSGYSSLSMLRNINVDVLKIDMRFFEKARTSGRGESIIASVIRMAKWLSIPVTAEGVETQEQVDFLRSIGCDYVQGFCFARPMPMDEYVQLVRDDKPERITVSDEPYYGLNPDRLWSLDPEMLLLFADDPSPKAIYEFDGNTLEALRVNKAYSSLFGFGDAVKDINPLQFIDPAHRDILLGSCRSCAEKRSPNNCEYRRTTPNGQTLWIRLAVQYIQCVGSKHILLGHVTDITALKNLERQYSEALSGSADLLRFELDHTFSLLNIRELLAFLSQVFDVARLVDPSHTALISFNENGRIEKTPYTCFHVWGKSTRCGNCTSIRSMQENCRMTKYEYIKNDIFYVVSNPILVQDGTGNEYKLALELVSHVSDHLTLGQFGDKSIGQIIEETQRKIYTDELTGAYNRRYLSGLLFAHHNQTGVAKSLGLVLLDLKNFKMINDRYGHSAGDDMLIATVQKLKESVRHNDSVIRYGGDEFVVTLTDCGEVQVKSAIERMQKAVATISFGENNENLLLADFGYSYTDVFDLRYETVEEMLRIADVAMYAKKGKDVKHNMQD